MAGAHLDCKVSTLYIRRWIQLVNILFSIFASM